MPEYSLRWATEEEFREVRGQHWRDAFPQLLSFERSQLLSEEEAARSEALRSADTSRVKLALLAHAADGSLAGWSYGFQSSGDEFFMCNSAVLPPHRRRGVYSKMLKAVLERVTADGFQVVHSHHHPTNNAVLIPKLRAGFVINGMEIDDRFGTLIKLSYYVSEFRRRVLHFRVGAERPDSRIRELLD